MTNPQIFIQGIIKTWWLWSPALIGILWTGLEVRCPYCGQAENIEIEKNKTFITRCNYCCKGFAFRKIELIKTFKIGGEKDD